MTTSRLVWAAATAVVATAMLALVAFGLHPSSRPDAAPPGTSSPRVTLAPSPYRVSAAKSLSGGRPTGGGRWFRLAPKATRDYVLWEQSGGGGTLLRCLDLATGRTRTIASLPTRAADSYATDGRLVVWAATRRHLDLYDLRDRRQYQRTVPGARIGRLALAGHVVVFEDLRRGLANADIGGYDLATRRAFTICAAPGPQLRPAVSGTIVVWEDWRGSSSDIRGYDLGAQRAFVVCAERGTQLRPAVSGRYVVWEDERNGTEDVYARDLATRKEIVVCRRPGNQGAPAVWNTVVVCQDTRAGNQDIYGFDLTTRTEFAVCMNPHSQGEPSIAADLVVWEDRRSGRAGIYGARLTPP